PNTDWYDIMFRTAEMQEHNLRVSGGSNLATYSVSVGYLDQDGIMVGTDAKRYSLNSNTTYKFSPKLEFGAIINASFWDINESQREGSDMMSGGPIGRALPIHPNILSDGRYGDTWLVTMGHNVFRHPYAIATESWMKNQTERAMINLFMEYTLPLDIKYKANFAVTNYNRYYHRWIPELYIFNPKEPDVPKLLRFDPPARNVDRTDNKSRDTNFFQTLNWTKTINEKHNVNLLLGFSRESFYNSNLNAYIEGFLGNELTEINAGTSNKDVGGTSNESKLMSYFGRAGYNYMDKYLLEFNFRYDGSSRFAKGNRWGFFPSVSAAWNIQEESFMQNIPWIYNLKLRGSWGQLGNQSISLYSYLSNINTGQNIVRDGTLLSGSAITALADPNITWESTTMTNIGLDLGFLDNRLGFEFDVFDKSTTDILARINIPSQVGNLTGPITNLYSMKNKGLEISTFYRGEIGDFSYNLRGNIGFVDNKVDYLAGDVQYSTNMFGTVSVIQEGYPVNSWYLFEALGLFQSQEEIDSHAFQHEKTQPGDIKYRDVNNDGVIDIDDMSVHGRSTPKATYGFSLDFAYKNFEFNSFFQGVSGIDTYPWHNIAFPLFNGAGIMKEHLGNMWTTDNRDAKYPRPTLYHRGNRVNSKNSTFWLQDISYLRLKNVQLAYNILPDQFNLLNNLNISSLKVYLNGQNLLTFSPYKLADPEKNITSERAAEYPNARLITVGFKLNF
ncbi:MAG: SusC/RagA family TonB-linked outer membrane protein, partial [Prolixibacteraceae bacterium]|nr:SusC/RagA family TonB-linked outer membrane protein [Prolixibacteraceae bacterium]